MCDSRNVNNFMYIEILFTTSQKNFLKDNKAMLEVTY